MIILLPVFLLVLASLGLLILQRLRPGFGLAWLIATSITSLVWFLFIYLRFHLSLGFTLLNWQPSTLFISSPYLLLDRVSWPYAFSLSTLGVGVILTATTRTRVKDAPYDWASSLVLIALGMLAVMAGNPFTLMEAWAAIDITELVILLSNLNERHLNQRIVLAFSARFTGIMILFWAVISHSIGEGASPTSFDLSHIPANAGFFVLLAAGLRLGVFPLHLPFSQEPRLRRSLGSVLRLVPVASSLVLLGRLPANIIPAYLVPFSLGLALLAALYCGLMWVKSTDELTGRPYWLIGWASLSVICVIRGFSYDGIAWGIAAILPGSLLFLFSARDRQLLIIPTIGLISLSGLPYTPAASGWLGLVSGSLSFLNILIILTQILFLVGYARHALRPEDIMTKVERWARVTYPTGLLLFLIADIIVGFWGWPGSSTIGIWWVGLVTMVILVIVGLIYNQLQSPKNQTSLIFKVWNYRIPKSIRWLFLKIIDAFRLDWFYQTTAWIYRGISFLLEKITGILEGEGGVLWALVILGLCLSLLYQGGL